ncbi:probable potassium transporter 17 isoform X1 [Tanacetum coccineum]
MRSIHKVTWFTTLRYLLVPKVAPNERFVVKRLGQGVYGCLIQYGYADSLDLQGDFVSHINASLEDHIMICLVMFEFLGMGLVGVVECVSGSRFGDGGGFLGGEGDVWKEVGGEIIVGNGTGCRKKMGVE